jgi:hypothetical protein
MVDMFFYRDPEEVEKQQQEDAAAKATTQPGEVEAPVAEWDVGGGGQPGGINPALAQEGGESSTLFWGQSSTSYSLDFQVHWIGLQMLQVLPRTGPPSLQVLLVGTLSLWALAAGDRMLSYMCTLSHAVFLFQ